MRSFLAAVLMVSFVAMASGLADSARACDGGKGHSKKCRLNKKKTSLKSQGGTSSPAAGTSAPQQN